MKENAEFIDRHTSALLNMKRCMGELCLNVRTRNQLSRELVADESGVSDKSIAKIEKEYSTSMDLVNMLYSYYVKQGYVSREEQKRNGIANLYTIDTQ